MGVDYAVRGDGQFPCSKSTQIQAISRDPSRHSRHFGCRAFAGVTLNSPIAKDICMANPNDPFSASIIPFEVPEQMRAFAEKGVSQARDNYAKFKDVAETHNGTIEAVFTSLSKGASEYSAKLVEMMKANTTTNLDFAQELLGVKTPAEA